MKKREEKVRTRIPWIARAALFFAAVAGILLKKEWKD